MADSGTICLGGLFLALKYFKTAKERFYDASSYSAEYLSSTTYAKDLNKQIKQLEELILPALKKSLEQ